MKNFLKALIVIPLAAAIVLFAIANRQIVTVHLDPFQTGLLPFDTVTLPLFIVLFATGLMGVLAGGVAAWLAQGKHRRAAKLHRREAETHRAELDRMKAREDAQSKLAALPPPASSR
jgi:uncharacterized integral membrane protein